MDDKKTDIASLYNEMSNLYGEESEINDAISIAENSILEFIHSYEVPDTYVSRNLVTQYRLITETPSDKNKYSLSDIYHLSNNIILNNYISCIFSSKVKFSSYQLKIYAPTNLSTPLLSTKKEYIPGVYGKLLEEPNFNKLFRITFKLKTTEEIDEMPVLWYRDLYLLGIPALMGEWDNPKTAVDTPLEALRNFIKAFSILKYKNFGIYCIGVNRGTKNEFLRENLIKNPKVISVTPKGFI